VFNQVIPGCKVVGCNGRSAICALEVSRAQVCVVRQTAHIPKGISHEEYSDYRKLKLVMKALPPRKGRHP